MESRAKSQFTKLSDLFPKVLKHYNVANPVSGAQVVNRWKVAVKEIIGLENIELAKAVHVKDKILTVEAANSSVAHEIHMSKLQLIEKLNEDFDEPRVKEIRCIQT